MLRIALVFASALLAATACGPLAARPLVTMAVIDRDNGQWLPEYPFRGQRWVAGIPGHRYAVRLTNASSERVLVVLSVDGVNAVTGETADTTQAGYVLAPSQSTEIDGWRKSLDDVAQFVFTDLPDSYAARTGRPDNVGVIGIAVFREARPIPHALPAPIARERVEPSSQPRAAATAAATSSGKAATGEREAAADSAYGAVAQAIGTGHGEREWSPVERTGFERASIRPAQITQLRYDDPDTLAMRGVLPRYRYLPEDAPDAFPAGFVPDPPHYR